MISFDSGGTQGSLLEKRDGDKAPDVDVRNSFAELGPVPLGILDALVVRTDPLHHQNLVPFREAGGISHSARQRGRGVRRCAHHLALGGESGKKIPTTTPRTMLSAAIITNSICHAFRRT
jgi:hypothetical protein